MAVIITRTDKGAPLTHAEMDANLNNLNNQITTHEAAADPHPGYVLESALGTTVSDAIDAHKAAADPHPGYALESSLGTAAAADVTTSETDTTAGRLITTDAGPVQAFKRSNIIGTVSQLSGVPTGAIIERDSNINGEYVKFADGTLLCTLDVLLDGVWESGVELQRLWVFPVSYASISAIYFMYSSTSAGAGVATTIGSVSSSSCSMNVKNNSMVDIGSGKYETRSAVGRWF